MKVLKWLDNYLEEVLMTLLLIAIAVIMLVQVIARYLFGNALTWSDELARYFLLWSGFLSVSYCVKRRISIKIEQVQSKFSPKALPWLKMLRHTIVFLFCIVMLPFCVTYVQQAVQNGAISPAMRIPMYYLQSAPLVCFVLLAIRVAQAWIREFRASRTLLVESIKQQLKDELLLEIKNEQAIGNNAPAAQEKEGENK